MKNKKIYILIRNLNRGGGLTKWVIDYYSKLTLYQDLDITLVIEKDVKGYNIEDLPFKCILLHLSNRRPLEQIKRWKELISLMDKDTIVHFHTDNLVNIIPLFLFRNFKEKFIVQSHSNSNYLVKSNFFKSVLHNLGKKMVKKYNFSKMAISDDAAKWLFDNEKYVLIENGIDIEKFAFSIEDRIQIRKKLKINENSRVYGHVGRFDDNKNQRKIISIFNELQKKNENSYLLLIGNGPLKNKVEMKAKELGILKKVKFLGLKKDVGKFLSSMDYFIFPSYYEGFGFALIEAQANGLNVLYSKTITKDVELLSTTKNFDIEDDDEKIANEIEKIRMNSFLYRQNAKYMVMEKGFSISSAVEELHLFYLNLT